MKECLGPSGALLSCNDAEFSDADFESIQKIGNSLKLKQSRGTKTGRFGIGINSVYHLTDVLSFTSGMSCVICIDECVYICICMCIYMYMYIYIYMYICIQVVCHM